MRQSSFENALFGVAMAVLLSASPVRADGLAFVDATTGASDEATPEVSTAQVRQILADGGALLLDTRPSAEFVNGHIPGANYLDGPPDQAVAGVEALVKGDKSAALVLYCNGPFCQASRRLAGQLKEAGFTDVRRYQLGMPVWRALGGPTAIEIAGVERIQRDDRTALFLDARPEAAFAGGGLAGAVNLSAEAAAKVMAPPMPGDDFNTRIVVFGTDGAEARALAEALSTRPWHNVLFYPGTYDLSAALGSKP